MLSAFFTVLLDGPNNAVLLLPAAAAVECFFSLSNAVAYCFHAE